MPSRASGASATLPKRRSSGANLPNTWSPPTDVRNELLASLRRSASSRQVVGRTSDTARTMPRKLHRRSSAGSKSAKHTRQQASKSIPALFSSKIRRKTQRLKPAPDAHGRGVDATNTWGAPVSPPAPPNSRISSPASKETQSQLCKARGKFNAQGSDGKDNVDEDTIHQKPAFMKSPVRDPARAVSHRLPSRGVSRNTSRSSRTRSTPLIQPQSAYTFAIAKRKTVHSAVVNAVPTAHPSFKGESHAPPPPPPARRGPPLVRRSEQDIKSPKKTVSKSAQFGSKYPIPPPPDQKVKARIQAAIKDGEEGSWTWAGPAMETIARKTSRLRKTKAAKLGRIWLADEIKKSDDHIAQTRQLLQSLERYKSNLVNKVKYGDKNPPVPRGKPPRSTQRLSGKKKKKRRWRPIKNVRKFLAWATSFLRSNDKKKHQDVAGTGAVAHSSIDVAIDVPSNATAESKASKLKSHSLRVSKGTHSRRRASVVFKTSLEDLVKDEDDICNVGVPRVVIETLDAIWCRGLLVEGIFRKCGNSDEVAAIAKRLELERSATVDWASLEIHVISGVLKKFIRNLTEPLIPYDMYDRVIALDRAKKTHEAFEYVISSLPEVHWRTFRLLFTLFKEIVKFKNVNKMDARNLAIVFAPNILRMRDESTAKFLADMKCQHRVVKHMIHVYDATTEGEQLYASLRAPKPKPAKAASTVPKVPRLL